MSQPHRKAQWKCCCLPRLLEIVAPLQLGRLAVDLSVHAERSAPSTNKRDLVSGRAVADVELINQRQTRLTNRCDAASDDFGYSGARSQWLCCMQKVIDPLKRHFGLGFCVTKGRLCLVQLVANNMTQSCAINIVALPVNRHVDPTPVTAPVSRSRRRWMH
jgi:hypothetical protein